MNRTADELLESLMANFQEKRKALTAKLREVQERESANMEKVKENIENLLATGDPEQKIHNDEDLVS